MPGTSPSESVDNEMLARRRGVIDPSELEALISETTDIVNAPVSWWDTGGDTPAAAEIAPAKSGVDKSRGYWDGRREGKRRDMLFKIGRGVGVNGDRLAAIYRKGCDMHCCTRVAIRACFN